MPAYGFTSNIGYTGIANEGPEITEVEVGCLMCEDSMKFNTPTNEWKAWDMGKCRGLIQNVMPSLKPEEREILISGTCPACWDRLFGKEE